MPCHIILPAEVSIGFRLPALAHEHLPQLFGTPRGAAVKQGVAFSAPLLEQGSGNLQQKHGKGDIPLIYR